MPTLQPDKKEPRSTAARLGDDPLLADLFDVVGPLLLVPVAIFLFAKWTWALCRWIARQGPSLDHRAWPDGGFDGPR